MDTNKKNDPGFLALPFFKKLVDHNKQLQKEKTELINELGRIWLLNSNYYCGFNHSKQTSKKSKKDKMGIEEPI